MAYALNPPRFPRLVAQFRALVQPTARVIASEHELAMRAATEAALHRRRLADLRVMYLSSQADARTAALI